MFDSGFPMLEPTKNDVANALHHRSARQMCSAGTEYSSGGSVRFPTHAVFSAVASRIAEALVR